MTTIEIVLTMLVGGFLGIVLIGIIALYFFIKIKKELEAGDD